jgi:tetratricopeptide (TPR) repeat protein
MTIDNSMRDELNARWQMMIVSGELSALKEEIDTRIETVTEQIDSAFLLNWKAVACIQLGMHSEALQVAQAALASVGADDSELVAKIHSNIAAALSGLGKIEESLTFFSAAEALFRDLGNEWSLGAVLVNHAGSEFARGQFGAGLALLDEAKSCAPRSDIERAQAAHRYTVIKVNRSSGLFKLGRVKESIDELLATRQGLLASGNSALLGTVDFNLADTYLHLHLYGSMLEAAESAAKAFREAGHEPMRRRSRFLVASALAQLGKYGRALEIVNELLSTAEKGSPEAVQLRSAAQAFGSQQGVWQIRNEQGAQQTGGKTEKQLEREVISERLDGLLDQDFSGPAYEESEILLTRLEALADHPAAKIAAKFERAIRDAYTDPENAQKLSRELREDAEVIVGPSLRNITGVVRGFAAVAADSTEEELNTWLEILWNLRESWHDQHDEKYRSDFLATRDSFRELTRGLDLAVEASRPSVIMEIIETFRIDISHLPSKVTRIGLPAFREISEENPLLNDPANGDPKKQTGASQQLIATDLFPISIRGTSAIAAAASINRTAIDIDQLRIAQAGDDALWWSFTILGQSLYWALLGPNFVHGGKREVPAEFTDALKAHLATLPIPQTSDLKLLEGSGQPTLVRLLALARSASTVMMGRPDIRDSALSALPVYLRESARAYCMAAEHVDVRGAYEQIAQILLPPELKQVITGARENGRLIVTLPPELATLPIGLLPASKKTVILDHMSIQCAPPPELTAKLTYRATGEAPRPLLLSIVDTTGDLANARAAKSADAAYALTGWANARQLKEIASRERLEWLFRSGAWSPGLSGVISYIGHLVPGSRDMPGSAALVCAPGSEADKPGLLSAYDILSWEPTFPSHLYLGGCEGTGFGTGLEWASVAAAALARGASCVLAHAWPIADCAETTEVDSSCINLLSSATDVGLALANAQRSWWDLWQQGLPDAIPPHFWAGLQLTGRSGAQPGGLNQNGENR